MVGASDGLSPRRLQPTLAWQANSGPSLDNGSAA